MKILKYLPTAFAAILLMCALPSGVSAEEENLPSEAETGIAEEQVQDSTKEAVTGWVENENGKRFFIDENGVALTGLCEVDGYTYYFRTVREDGKVNTEAEIELMDV